MNTNRHEFIRHECTATARHNADRFVSIRVYSWFKLLGRRRDVLATPGIASLLGFFKKFLDGFAVGLFEREPEFLQVLNEHAEDARKIAAIRQRDVVPHLRRTRPDARGVSETIGAQYRLLPRMR